MKIKDLLRISNRVVVTIGPDETVAAAIKKLAEYNRGSISVCNEKDELVGIITERDIVRKCLLHGNPASIRIADVMSKEVAIGSPDDDLDYAISAMKQKRIRHLPIVDNHKVVGMVSMRDLLDVQLSERQAEIRYAKLLPKRPRRTIV